MNVIEQLFPLEDVQSWMKDLKEQASQVDRLAKIIIKIVVEQTLSTREEEWEELDATTTEKTTTTTTKTTELTVEINLDLENNIEEYDFKEELKELNEIARSVKSYVADFQIIGEGSSGKEFGRKVIHFRGTVK
jgi:hypothetical protein